MFWEFSLLLQRTLVARLFAVATCPAFVKEMGKYYAVAKGKKVGVYLSWPECQEQVLGFFAAKYRKFDTEEEAWAFIEANKASPEKKPHMMHSSPVKPANSDFSSVMANLRKNLDGLQESFDKFVAFTSAELRALREGMGQLENMFVSKGMETRPEKNLFSQRSMATTSTVFSDSRKRSAKDHDGNERLKIPKTDHGKDDDTSDDSSEDYGSIGGIKREKESLSSAAGLKVDTEGFLHVFTDGACENNGFSGAKAGIGVWFGVNHPWNLSAPVNGRATNNTGEIQAAAQALKIAKENGFTKCVVHTDSKFVISSITEWIRGWKRNGWQLSRGGGPVKNREDFEALDSIMKGMTVKWVHVKGHAGIQGNEEADALARAGAMRYVP